MPTTKSKKSTKKQSTSKSARASKNGKKKAKAASKSAKPAAAKTAKVSSPVKASGNGTPSGRAPARRSTQDARPPQDMRLLVQERKILRSQSRWLQKALFALAKAEDDQEKLAEVRGDAHEPMAVTVAGTTHQIGDVTDSLRDSVMERLEGLRVTLRNEHALLG